MLENITEQIPTTSNIPTEQPAEETATVEIEEPVETITLKNVLGYEEEKDSVRKIITLLKEYDKYSQQGVNIPRGLIFQGPPGTGKTLFAKAIAGECGFRFFTAFSGELEENPLKTLKQTFKEAEAYAIEQKTPSLIYIDEIDKLTYTNHRGELADSQSREAVRFLLQKLDETKSKNKILIIASTNDYYSIPKALLRSGRFDKKILIDAPDVKSREKILEYYINNNPLFKKINLKRLALKTSGMSGADLKTLINNTLVEYVTTKTEIEEDDFLKVIKEMQFETIGKQWKSDRKALKILVHEAGHSIVSGVLRDDYGEISAVRYGNINGVTRFEGMPEEDDWEEDYANKLSKSDQTARSLINNIIVSFGGMAAEKVILHENSVGASGDSNVIKVSLGGLCDLGVYGLKYSAEFKTVGNNHWNVVNKKQLHLCRKYYRMSKRIVRRNKMLLYFLIDEVHKNNDVMSSETVREKVNYFNLHKKELSKKYRRVSLEMLYNK